MSASRDAARWRSAAEDQWARCARLQDDVADLKATVRAHFMDWVNANGIDHIDRAARPGDLLLWSEVLGPDLRMVAERAMEAVR